MKRRALNVRDYGALRRLGRPDDMQPNPNFETGIDGLVATLRTRPPAPLLRF